MLTSGEDLGQAHRPHRDEEIKYQGLGSYQEQAQTPPQLPAPGTNLSILSADAWGTSLLGLTSLSLPQLDSLG